MPSNSFFRQGSIIFLLVAAFTVSAAPVSAQQVAVPITFHHQEHSLSCEVATLKMALQTQGVTVSEAELISKLPFDPTPKQPGIWGDPNEGFVGKINGRMLVTGYGVYWDPIAELGAKYAATQVMKHGSATQLAQQISQGNPVIIWGHFGRPTPFSWLSAVGVRIKAVNGEHTRVVYGFDGPVTAPTRFYVMDPSVGALTWSTAELMQNWSSLDHMGVVVLPAKQWVRLPNDTVIWEINNQQQTRQPITSWAAFTRRGGSPAAIHSIDSKSLLTYKVGSSIN